MPDINPIFKIATDPDENVQRIKFLWSWKISQNILLIAILNFLLHWTSSIWHVLILSNIVSQYQNRTYFVVTWWSTGIIIIFFILNEALRWPSWISNFIPSQLTLHLHCIPISMPNIKRICQDFMMCIMRTKSSTDTV
jgi:hypothetical protein